MMSSSMRATNVRPSQSECLILPKMGTATTTQPTRARVKTRCVGNGMPIPHHRVMARLLLSLANPPKEELRRGQAAAPSGVDYYDYDHTSSCASCTCMATFCRPDDCTSGNAHAPKVGDVHGTCQVQKIGSSNKHNTGPMARMA
jgi:hypothetical protein